MPPANVEKVGYWGEVTSTLDWCEENYVHNYYFAEFWNTISNSAMILPSVFGFFYFYKLKLELRFILSTLSLLAVGIGSWMFHMTLWFEMQMLDELPMIYGSCVFLYALRQRSKPRDYIDRKEIMVYFLISTSVTFVYLIIQHPVFHQFCYGLLVMAIVYEGVSAMKETPVIGPLVMTSLISYVIGFILWNIDNQLCSSLRQARDVTLPPVFRPITQLHSWWHLLTGYGTYLHILFSIQARSLNLKRNCQVFFLFGVFPYHITLDDCE